jgi:hypothetical protein
MKRRTFLVVLSVTILGALLLYDRLFVMHWDGDQDFRLSIEYRGRRIEAAEVLYAGAPSTEMARASASSTEVREHWRQQAHHPESEKGLLVGQVQTSGSRSGLGLTDTRHVMPCVAIEVRPRDGGEFFLVCPTPKPETEGIHLKLGVETRE